MAANRFSSRCQACGKKVRSYEGKVEWNGRKWVVWCMACFDQSDNSSYEDRVCGNRAWEEQCAERCGEEEEES